jgi:hypothetical protein
MLITETFLQSNLIDGKVVKVKQLSAHLIKGSSIRYQNKNSI